MYTTANKSPHVNSRNLYIWWFPCSEIRWQLDAQCTATCAIVAKKMQSNNKTCLLHTGRFMAHLKLIYMAFHGSFTLFRKWYCDLLYIQTRIQTISVPFTANVCGFFGVGWKRVLLNILSINQLQVSLTILVKTYL